MIVDSALAEMGYRLDGGLFADFAFGQIQKCLAWLEAARGASLGEITRTTNVVIEAGDG